jgi:hypothetical protein
VVTVENKIAKGLAARRDAISIQATVENEGVLSGLAKLGRGSIVNCHYIQTKNPD